MHKGVATLVMENDSSRPLLESTGWLAAHRRYQSWLKQNPVHFHRKSLTGAVPMGPITRSFEEWRSWSLMLFKKMTAGDDPSTLNEA